MPNALRNLRHSLRLLRRYPGFAAIAILTLALGIGANTAIFSVVNATLLKALPFAEPDRLLLIHLHPAGQPETFVELTYPDYRDWREQNSSFLDIAAVPSTLGKLYLEREGELVQVNGTPVSGNLFSVLGVQPVLGRSFSAEDDQVGADRVAVISYGLWQRLFGEDPDLIGSGTVRLGGSAHTLIGVMPPEFVYPPRTEVWTALEPAVAGLVDNRSVGFVRLVGRLKPGVTMEQARADVDVLLEEITAPFFQPGVERGVTIKPLGERLFGDVRTPLFILLGAAGLVLLIACANVANLLIARGTSRQRELAVRTALGASRRRLAGLMLAESAVLAFIGGGLGLALAGWGVNRLLAMGPQNLYRASQVGIDGAVLAFTVAACLVTTFLFGLAPALHGTKPRLAEDLKEGAGRSTGGIRGRRLLSALVISEVALAIMLVIGAGLLIRSFARLYNIDTGFERERVLTVALVFPQGQYGQQQEWRDFYDELIRRAESVPGVSRAAGVLLRPLETPQGYDYPFSVEGQTVTEQQNNPLLNYQGVTPDYFAVTGLRLTRGRAFSAADNDDAPPVVIVGQQMAQRFWPNEDPIGKRLKWGPPDSQSPWREVVGVAANARYRGMQVTRLDVYTPYRQNPWRLNHLVVRTEITAASLVPSIRGVIRGLDPQVHGMEAVTIKQLVSASLTRQRFNTVLLGLLGGLAMTLGAVGIYGVLAYMVSQRTQEIGVRVALGAAPRDVLKLVVLEGVFVAAIGVVFGVLGALILTRVMSGLLYEISATDPLTFVAVPALVLVVAFLASYVPAWRAARVDPMVALRSE